MIQYLNVFFNIYNCMLYAIFDEYILLQFCSFIEINIHKNDHKEQID